MSIPCVVCNEEEGTVVLEYTEPDIYEKKVGITSEGYWRNWICCSQCGMYRSEFSRDPEILHTIYEKEYRATGAEWRKNTVEELFLRIIKHCEFLLPLKRSIIMIDLTVITTV